MVQQVLVQLVDDLDGETTDDVSTVSFSLDGVHYEIDLTEDNAERLRGQMAVFVENGRRTGGRVNRRSGRAASKAPANGEAEAIREWATENGYKLSSRGRLPKHVLEAYKHAKESAGTGQRSVGPATKGQQGGRAGQTSAGSEGKTAPAKKRGHAKRQ